MKKIFSLLLAGIMLLSFTGCSKPTPEDAVSSFIDAVKTNNTEELEKQPISINGENVFDALSTDSNNDISEDTLKDMVSGIEYKINGSEISEDGNSATVDVTITNSNYGDAIHLVFSDALTIAFSGYGQKETDKKIIEALERRFKDAKIKDPIDVNAKVKLVKNDDNTWQISKEGNEELMNALTGNLYKEIDELNKSFKDK